MTCTARRGDEARGAAMKSAVSPNASQCDVCVLKGSRVVLKLAACDRDNNTEH